MISKSWNPDIAARRFLAFVQEIQEKKNCDLFFEGPCSKAEIIKNDWFGD